MLSRQFLSWAERATAGERAEAAGNLARAFLYAELDPIERGEMERAMTCLLDDGSPLVRRALAEALAGSADAPHHLVSALANDQPDIAALVLARSPRLTDAELIDAVALGEAPAQCAIAARPGLSAAVAGALAEVGGAEAALVLCRNPRRHARRHLDPPHPGALRPRRRVARGPRSPLRPRRRAAPRPRRRHRRGVARLRHRLPVDGAPERARRVAADETDRAALSLAGQNPDAQGDLAQLRFAADLRRAGRLTPALVLRALLSGQFALFEAALAELSGQRLGRVSGLVRRHDGLAFAALVRSAGFPDGLLAVLRTALAARRPAEIEAPALLRRDVVARVLAHCGIDRDTSVTGLTALLRRFESEAAREESRTAASGPHRTALAERRIEPHFDLAPEAVVHLAAAA